MNKKTFKKTLNTWDMMMRTFNTWNIKNMTYPLKMSHEKTHT